jgi:hypothetical protein
MWRKAFFTAAVLVCARSAWAQSPAPISNPDLPQLRGAPQSTPLILPKGPSGSTTGASSIGNRPTPPTKEAPPILLPQMPNIITQTQVPVPTVPPINQQIGSISGITALPQDKGITFDPERTDLQCRDDHWQLWSGNVMLKDFGRSEREGREVLKVVRDLKLTSMSSLGTPKPVMEFWLVNGQAPHGHIPGLRSISLKPTEVKAEQVQGQWCVHDGKQILFNFTDQADVARQAVATIQRYNFTEVAYVGQTSPTMLVFLSNPPTQPILQQVQHQQEASKNPFDTATLMHKFHNYQDQGTAMPNAQAGLLPGQMPEIAALPLKSPQLTKPTPPASAPETGQAAKQTDPNSAGNHVTFTARQLDVHRDGDEWKLMAGSTMLASFGPKQNDAILARAALLQFKITEEVVIGKPKPTMTYFLANGQAPTGATPFGLNSTPIRPETLSLQSNGKSYVITDGSQVLVSCEHPEDAQQALQALQQYKFDRVCHIGNGDRGLTILSKEK